MRCDVCDCSIHINEDVYETFAKDRYWNICEPCAICAERLGHSLISIYTLEDQ